MERRDAEELFLWVLEKPEDEDKKEEFIRTLVAEQKQCIGPNSQYRHIFQKTVMD